MVHSSVYVVDAVHEPERTYLVVLPDVPLELGRLERVLFVRLRLDGYYDEGAVWCPLQITCGGMLEQLDLDILCGQEGECKCYLNAPGE